MVSNLNMTQCQVFPQTTCASLIVMHRWLNLTYKIPSVFAPFLEFTSLVCEAMLLFQLLINNRAWTPTKILRTNKPFYSEKYFLFYKTGYASLFNFPCIMTKFIKLSPLCLAHPKIMRTRARRTQTRQTITKMKRVTPIQMEKKRL